MPSCISATHPLSLGVLVQFADLECCVLGQVRHTGQPWTLTDCVSRQTQQIDSDRLALVLDVLPQVTPVMKVVAAAHREARQQGCLKQGGCQQQGGQQGLCCHCDSSLTAG